MTKTQNRSLISVFLLFVFCITALTGCRDDNGKTNSFFALDTFISVTVYGPGAEEKADACEKLCRQYEKMFSPSLEESEIFRLNCREISEVSAETAELIREGLFYSELSGGAFDITVGAVTELWDFHGENPVLPARDKLQTALKSVGYHYVHVNGCRVLFDREDTKIDLGAMAKGYIADRLSAYLTESGTESALIDLGGNIVCVGNKPNGQPFRVGIQKPEQGSDEIIATVAGENLSVVTSGVFQRCFTYEGKNYHHILHSETGVPVENGLVSVTILGKSSLQCDALSTVCFVLGQQQGLELIEKTENVEALFVTEAGEQICSSGFNRWKG